jgi:hypothetical protein
MSSSSGNSIGGEAVDPRGRRMNDQRIFAPVAKAGGAGAVLWVATAALAGKREAWDAAAYRLLAYPAALLACAYLGRAYPTHPRRWALLLFGATHCHVLSQSRVREHLSAGRGVVWHPGICPACRWPAWRLGRISGPQARALSDLRVDARSRGRPSLNRSGVLQCTKAHATVVPFG